MHIRITLKDVLGVFIDVLRVVMDVLGVAITSVFSVDISSSVCLLITCHCSDIVFQLCVSHSELSTCLLFFISTVI